MPLPFIIYYLLLQQIQDCQYRKIEIRARSKVWRSLPIRRAMSRLAVIIDGEWLTPTRPDADDDLAHDEC